MLFILVKRDVVLKAEKMEQASTVKDFDLEKSAFCQHMLEHDGVIDWKNVEILKSEPRVNTVAPRKVF